MSRFQDKVVVITGGSTGIGLATAQAFAREGAKLVITGRGQGNLDNAVSQIDGEVLPLVASASDMADIDRLISETVGRFGAIDIMFLNAGPGGKHTEFANTTEENFDAFCDTNFKGPFFTVQKALPHLRKGASIVFCSSISNAIGQVGLSVYAGAKAAQRAMTRVLATELGPKGIRVNCVSPGFIDTPIFDKGGVPDAVRNEIREMVSRQAKVGRIGRAEDIASAVLYLASDESSYVIGQEIIVDGGYTIVT
ncbi:MAG: glucose 1-dehydrogenase [Gammaproteobacteria bacterium]|nr:glucose 1-dehydrogenase [Gammaproteobacteria bacterium]